MSKHADDQGDYWLVRWREGGRGRRGHSRQKKHRKKGLADAHLRKVREIEDRRGLALPGGDGRWTMQRFFDEKFLPLRSGTVTAGTAGQWRRRWCPLSQPPSPWHLKSAWGAWALEEINREAVMTWHAKMRRAGASDATMFRAHDLLVNILSFAVELGYITVHPALNMQVDYQPKRVVDHWRPDTIEKIRRHFEAWSQRARCDVRWSRLRDSYLIAVLAYAGVRPGEALALTWRNVYEKAGYLWVTHTIAGLDDEDDGEQTIENGRTKTSKERFVPFRMVPFLPEILSEWEALVGQHELDDPVFPWHEGANDHWNYNAWTNWRRASWVKALRELELTYRKPYHLRHSAVTMWIYAGVPINEVAKRAGHTMEVCMRTYAGAWDTFDPDHDERFDISAAFRAARREARRLRLVA